MKPWEMIVRRLKFKNCEVLNLQDFFQDLIKISWVLFFQGRLYFRLPVDYMPEMPKHSQATRGNETRNQFGQTGLGKGQLVFVNLLVMKQIIRKWNTAIQVCAGTGIYF